LWTSENFLPTPENSYRLLKTTLRSPLTAAGCLMWRTKGSARDKRLIQVQQIDDVADPVISSASSSVGEAMASVRRSTAPQQQRHSTGIIWAL